MGGTRRRAVPASPLRYADRAGYAGTSEESVDYQRQELPQDLLRTEQYGYLCGGRFRSRRDDRHYRQVFRCDGAQPESSETGVRARAAHHDARRQGGLRPRSGQRHVGLASAGCERSVERRCGFGRSVDLQRAGRSDRHRSEPSAEGIGRLRLCFDTARLQHVPRGRSSEAGPDPRRGARPAARRGGQTAQWRFRRRAARSHHQQLQDVRVAADGERPRRPLCQCVHLRNGLGRRGTLDRPAVENHQAGRHRLGQRVSRSRKLCRYLQTRG